MFRVTLLVRLLALLATAVSVINAAPSAEMATSEPLNQRGGYKFDCAAVNKHSAQAVIDKLGLVANVEKGYYIQTFEDPDTVAGTTRSVSTAIYYLLEGREGWSHWHHIDAVEVWHYYAGAPLNLGLGSNGTAPGPATIHTLGPDIFHGQSPQIAINKWQWQHAKSLGAWTLVGTTVAPGFNPNGFECPDCPSS